MELFSLEFIIPQQASCLQINKEKLDLSLTIDLQGDSIICHC